MDEQMTTDNPAARAFRVLKAIEAMPNTTETKKAWREALGIKGNDEGPLLIGLGQFIAVTTEAVELMNDRYPPLKSQTTTWHRTFTKAMQEQVLTSHISTFTSRYSSASNDFLQVMNQMLAIDSPPEIDGLVILDFQQAISNLIKEVISSDVEIKVKEYLVKSLRKVESALDNYRFTGVVPVLESIEIVAGHMFTDSNFKKSLDADLGYKVFSTLGAVADGVSIATGAPPSLWAQLGEGLKGLLPQSV
jgi:hypothetical protein